MLNTKNMRLICSIQIMTEYSSRTEEFLHIQRTNNNNSIQNVE